MYISTLFLIIIYFLVTTEGCMRMVPPDDVYIPSTLAPEQSTLAPEDVSIPETSEGTDAPEVTMMTTPAMESSTVTDNVDMTTDTDGCIELSCVPGNDPFLGASFDNSEIPPPSAGDVGDDFLIITPIPPQQVVGGLNEYYGLVCENNKLKATEYPLGIATFSGSGNFGADGSYSGKKTALNGLTCD